MASEFELLSLGGPGQSIMGLGSYNMGHSVGGSTPNPSAQAFYMSSGVHQSAYLAKFGDDQHSYAPNVNQLSFLNSAPEMDSAPHFLSSLPNRKADRLPALPAIDEITGIQAIGRLSGSFEDGEATELPSHGAPQRNKRKSATGVTSTKQTSTKSPNGAAAPNQRPWWRCCA